MKNIDLGRLPASSKEFLYPFLCFFMPGIKLSLLYFTFIYKDKTRRWTEKGRCDVGTDKKVDEQDWDEENKHDEEQEGQGLEGQGAVSVWDQPVIQKIYAPCHHNCS